MMIHISPQWFQSICCNKNSLLFQLAAMNIYQKQSLRDVPWNQLRVTMKAFFAIFIRCSRLRLWVDYFICFKFTPVLFNGCFPWILFNSIKEKNRLRKEINRLISKGMSNIYLKVTVKKNWLSQNSDFLSLRNLSPGQFLESSSSCRYHWILKLLVAT